VLQSSSLHAAASMPTIVTTQSSTSVLSTNAASSANLLSRQDTSGSSNIMTRQGISGASSNLVTRQEISGASSTLVGRQEVSGGSASYLPRQDISGSTSNYVTRQEIHGGKSSLVTRQEITSIPSLNTSSSTAAHPIVGASQSHVPLSPRTGKRVLTSANSTMTPATSTLKSATSAMTPRVPTSATNLQNAAQGTNVQSYILPWQSSVAKSSATSPTHAASTVPKVRSPESQLMPMDPSRGREEAMPAASLASAHTPRAPLGSGRLSVKAPPQPLLADRYMAATPRNPMIVNSDPKMSVASGLSSHTRYLPAEPDRSGAMGIRHMPQCTYVRA